MIKVKVYNKEDIVAFVVPKSVKFAQLKEKAFKKVLKAGPRPGGGGGGGAGGGGGGGGGGRRVGDPAGRWSGW